MTITPQMVIYKTWLEMSLILIIKSTSNKKNMSG